MKGNRAFSFVPFSFVRRFLMSFHWIPNTTQPCRLYVIRPSNYQNAYCIRWCARYFCCRFRCWTNSNSRDDKKKQDIFAQKRRTKSLKCCRFAEGVQLNKFDFHVGSRVLADCVRTVFRPVWRNTTNVLYCMYISPIVRVRCEFHLDLLGRNRDGWAEIQKTLANWYRLFRRPNRAVQIQQSRKGRRKKWLRSCVLWL